MNEESRPVLSESRWPMTNFHNSVRAAATTEGAEVKPETDLASVAEESPVPESYKELMAEHQRLYRAIPSEKSKATRQKLTERHAIVKSKLAAMQNGAPAPTITADHCATIAQARLNQPATRAARLRKLKDALAVAEGDEAIEGAKKSFLAIPMTPLRPVSDVIQMFLKCPWVAISVAVLREAIATYEVQLLECWPIAHPAERLIEIRDAEISNCADPEKIRELHAEAARLASPTATLTAQNTRLVLQKLWGPVKDAEFRLLAQCQIELERGMSDEQLAHERKLPETHPLKIFDLTRQDIERRIADLFGASEQALPQLNGVPPKTSEQTALTSLLGLGVLADE